MMASMTLNQELNGIEIKFDTKPIRETIESLKEAGFRWHKVKKIWYAKQNESRLALAKEIAGNEIKADSKPEKKTETATQKKNKYGVQVGDVFYDSWGYEQTNIDFYQVIALRGATQVVLAAIGCESQSNGWCSAKVKPKKDDFLTGNYKTRQQDGDSIIKTVHKYGDSIMAGFGRDALFLTSWEVEHTETSYY